MRREAPLGCLRELTLEEPGTLSKGAHWGSETAVLPSGKEGPMKIEKLFNVLVVGGALMAGCGGVPAVPDEMPIGTPEVPATAPASDAKDAPEGDDAQKPADGEKKADGEDGSCAWF